MQQSQLKGSRYVVPKKNFILRFAYNQFLIILGSILAAFGYVVFQVPFQIAAGGISGLAIIINEYSGLTVGMLYFLFNIPLLVVGYYQLGGLKFIFSTINSVITFSAASDLFVRLLPVYMDVFPLSQDLLLNCIYAGVSVGLGAGIIYRAGGSMGGTSIPARILQKRMGFPLSQSYLYTDMIVIVLAGFVFSWEKAMLALLTLLLGGMASDFVLEGVSQVRIAWIITDNPKVMSRTLMAELQRGVSMWQMTGAYSDTERTMIYCTVRRSQVSDLKFLVAAIDPKAFLVIGTAQQAWGGTGFTHLKSPSGR
ncbi:YitT family protein [Geovibrio thiophilus]|uniref:YitT family protein n=1 Tax=Geovibrio thiophilus TaxID=139438 RepID=A0A410K1U8_9BACT|nr:YitT family protein [Geovibrio thiophilus]QAR34407.1 YitT family protein [Geovibrio thiophilus]